MIRLREIHTTDKEYAFVEQLWLAAFPDDERRDTPLQRYNTDHNPVFHCMLAEDEKMFVGFFTYWDFGQYCYGEHFAIDATLRNHGYGSQILSTLLTLIDKPLVIEVEMPTDTMSRRRIGFYQRNGMHLWEGYDYIQPPYRPNGNALPMLLMASDGLSPAKDCHEIVQTIHRRVYGWCTSESNIVNS